MLHMHVINKRTYILPGFSLVFQVSPESQEPICCPTVLEQQAYINIPRRRDGLKNAQAPSLSQRHILSMFWA